MIQRPLVVVGPTAVGKSALALAVARELGNAEIVSADSMQVYRRMDIGTAKPSLDEQAEFPHHLIDLVDVDQEFGVADFQEQARAAIADIVARGRFPILVGGTGLYVRSIVDALEIPGQYPAVRAVLEAQPDTAALHAELGVADPLAASRMDPLNRRRVIRALEVTRGSGRPFSSFGPGLEAYPEVDFVQIGLDAERDLLDERIAARYDAQMDAGFLDEVREVYAHPAGMARTAQQALGYKELIAHLEDGVDLSECLELAKRRTRRFARRQQKWFRRDPRITWYSLNDADGSNLVSITADVVRNCLL